MLSSPFRKVLPSFISPLALGLVIVFTLHALPAPAQSASGVVYVDQHRDGGGDDSNTTGTDTTEGTSWATAFRRIQQGVDAAGSGGQVWVANGNYDERVTLNDGVILLGGFSGDETEVSQRNSGKNRATINSDGLEGVTSGTVVIKGVTSTRLDGFTITGALSFGGGGGIYCEDADSSNNIANCILTGNRPFYGPAAGIYCRNASPGIIGCVITGNQGGAQGGGIVCEAASSPGIMSCTIRNNDANGVICGEGCSPTLVNTILNDEPGAAVALTAADANPVLIHNLFDNNGANIRTAAGKTTNDVNTINMTFAGAYGNVNGDPKFSGGDESFHIEDGSAALERGLLAAATSNDIDKDERPGDDGKLDIGADEAPTSYRPANDKTPPVSQVLPPPAVSVGATLNLSFAASDAQSGLDKLKLFYRRNGGPWTRYGDWFRESPIPFGGAVLEGDGYYEFYTQALDLADNLEAAPARADAATQLYSRFTGSRLYVKPVASGARTGESWADALTSLQRALTIAAALGGTVKEIWVAGGTFIPSTTNRAASFQLLDGVAVYGGFKGNETSLAQRNLAGTPTILSGDLGRNDSPAASSSGTDETATMTDNSRHVVSAIGVGNGTILDGFTISGGYADGTAEDANGAGVFIGRADPILRNLTITGNRTADRPSGASAAYRHAGAGAGVYCTSGSQPQLLKCRVTDNRTGHGARTGVGSTFLVGNGGDGAGIAARESILTLTDSEVSGNVTGWGGTRAGSGAAGQGGRGAGIYCDGGGLTATRCRISGNATGAGLTADEGDTYKGGDGGDGGGFYGSDTAASFTDCVFQDNRTGAGANGRTAGLGGAGAGLCFFATTTTLQMNDCTVQGNVTAPGGASRVQPGRGGDGAGLALDGATAVLTACTFTSNTTGNGGTDLLEASPAAAGSGGGIHANAATLTLTRSALTYNRTGRGSNNAYAAGAGGDGAGLRAVNTNGTVTNTIIAGNVAGDGGRGTSNPEATGETRAVTGGRGGNGGGLALTNSPLAIRLATIAGNAAGTGGNKSATARRVEGADGKGGGLASDGAQSSQLTDAILWGNRVFTGGGEAAQLSGKATFGSCCVEGWSGALGGSGNFAADPQFMNPATLDLRLRAGSPAIDRGIAIGGVTEDFTGAGRPYDGDGKGNSTTGDGSDTDIGAYEYRGSRVGPTLISLLKADADPTAAARVRYVLTFSEAVTGVTGADFVLTAPGLSGVKMVGLVNGGQVSTVTLSTGSGVSGTLRLDLRDSGTGIQNARGQALRAGAIGPVYTVDRVAPRVAITPPDPRFDTSLPDLTLRGSASDTGSAVARVRVRLNGGAWQTPSGLTQWSMAGRLVPLDNRIEAQSFDAAGNASPIATLDYVYHIGDGDDILRYLLGMGASSAGMDLNADGKVDIADLLKARK